MLNTCPPQYSCGSRVAIWTDEEVPEDVLSAASITVYGSTYISHSTPADCLHFTYQVKVMRCSLDTDYDLIYRYIGVYHTSCEGAFCGMN